MIRPVGFRFLNAESFRTIRAMQPFARFSLVGSENLARIENQRIWYCLCCIVLLIERLAQQSQYGYTMKGTNHG
jgi:hypothetical protein